MPAALASRPIQPSAYQPVDTSSTANTRLAALPKSAQTKFEKLRRAELRSRAMRDGLYEQQERVREQLHDAMRELALFDRRWPAEWRYQDVDTKTGERKKVAVERPERAALVAQIEAAKTELARLSEEQSAAEIGFSTSGILDFLVASSAKFTAAPVPLIKLSKGETFSDALKRTRDAQATIADEIATTQNAPLTIAAAKAAMRDQVDALAERGRPDVAALFDGGTITWPTEQFTAGGNGVHPHIVSTTIKDAFAFTVCAHRDAIVAQLDAEIERTGDDTNALSADAQAARIAELRAALLQLHRHEEAVIERLEAEGVQVRRNCSDPLVLLGIEQ